ncbi:helix-turn-helix domain-containing protein [Xylophilus sp. Kf1]|nr:helix-turn-helix domain-containing protein [Xylophilus sp. Kf1]
MPENARLAVVHRKDVTAFPSPTQSLDRALDLLDVVVRHAVAGISLGSLSAIVGLSKPTAHRLLGGLRTSGLIDYDNVRRLFYPAFKLYSMGQAAAVRFDVIPAATASLERLAEETGDTVFLTARSGDFAVCVARSAGSFPIKTLTLNVGDVRPLGLGANGLVLLAALRDDDVERNLVRHRDALRPWPRFDDASVRQWIAETRENGYGFSEGLVLPDMSALAVGIKGAQGSVDAVISVAAITSRMQPPRRQSLAALLRKEVDAIERLMEDRSYGRRPA